MDRWLSLKVSRLQRLIIDGQLPHCRLILSPNAEERRAEALKYAVGVVSEYLVEEVLQKLLDSFA